MSVTRGGTDENDRLDYNNLQYQYVGFKRNVTDPSVNQAFDINTEAIDERELDHDELAELVYLRRIMSLQVDEDPGDASQSETGNLQVSATLEVNSGEGEWLTSDQRDPEFVEENNRNLDASEMSYSVAFVDTSASAGGPGGGDTHSEREVMYAGPNGLFDHGPVLDANDSLDARFELDKRNIVFNTRLRCYYVLGWRVHRIEDARPEFGIPY